MDVLYSFTTPTGPCGYLPDRQWKLRYDLVRELTAAEYSALMRRGWRKFGHSLFRPVCPSCQACQPLRVDVAKFQPTTSQRRALKKNAGVIDLRIGTPAVSDEKLALYDKFHEFQAGFKDWPDRDPESPDSYADSFVENPIPSEEWCYYLGDDLVGVGYVDVVPDGLSAVYFYYDPEHRDHSLGTWNVLQVIAAAAERKLPYVYLGYLVKGCRSLEYKGRFGPNEAYHWDADAWRPTG